MKIWTVKLFHGGLQHRIFELNNQKHLNDDQPHPMIQG